MMSPGNNRRLVSLIRIDNQPTKTEETHTEREIGNALLIIAFFVVIGWLGSIDKLQDVMLAALMGKLPAIPAGP
jgi:hypothetical protein